MAEETITTQNPTPIDQKKQPWYQYLIDAVAVLVWVYTIVNLFVYDIDAFLISRLPSYLSWIVEYKFFVLIGALAVLWLFTRSSRVIGWFLYVLFWPVLFLIWLIWKVSAFLWKKGSWTLTFAIINIILSLFKKIKQNFIILTSLLVFTFIIFVTSNKIMLWLSILALLITLLAIFMRRFVIIFRPSTLYQIYSKAASFILKNSKTSLAVEKEVRELGIENAEPAQLKKWSGNLQAAILVNRGAYFLSSKLAEYQRSKLNILFYVINFLMLVLISALIFSFISFGLYKIDPNYFNVSTSPTFFIFFYYGANTLLNHVITEVTPAMTISRIFNLIEIAFTFLLVGVFLTLLLSVNDNRETAEIKAVIEDIKKQGDQMEGFIQEEYQLSITEAIAKLLALKVELSSMKLIEYLSKYVN